MAGLQIKSTIDSLGSIVPQQRRSKDTHRRIVDVVMKLVENGDYDRSNVQDIARAANCSIGAFYGRFKNRDAVLLAIVDSRCDELTDRLGPLFEPSEFERVGLGETLSRFIDIIFDHTLSGAALIKTTPVLSMGAHDNDPFMARWREQNTRLFIWLKTLFLYHKGDIQHQEVDVAVLICLGIIGGLCRDAVMLGDKLSEKKPGKLKFKNEILRAVTAYLAGASP